MAEHHEIPEARRNLTEIVGGNTAHELRHWRVVVQAGANSAVAQIQLKLTLGSVTERVVFGENQSCLDDRELNPEGNGEVAAGETQARTVGRRQSLPQSGHHVGAGTDLAGHLGH